MKKRTPATLAILGIIPLSACSQQSEIVEAQDTCTVSTQTLEGWFADGTVKNGALVNPADGTVFPPVENTACDFYQWASQMFLWLSSPSGSAYVFDGASFYDVLSSGNGYVFQSNVNGSANRFALRTVKTDEEQSTGQAGGGGVLISQNGSLTYYGIHTNNVYAYYLTGQKAGAFSGTSIAEDFPTTAQDLDAVENYAGMTFADGMALAMEVKTSWVDAKTVDDPARYITIDAYVPAYSRDNDQTWTKQSEPELKTLALVGLHIAATVNGHPEMVWATFEHVNNAPDAAYYILDNNGNPVEVPYDSSGDWVYMESGGSETDHIPERAHVDSDTGNIVASEGETIGSANVIRLNPWGDLPDNTDAAMNNTDLVSLNSSILSQLSAIGDVRANYIQIGGIWSQKGQIPSSGTDDFLRGSLYLANATMETFHQYPDENNGFVSNNCFTCHSTSSGDGVNVSHIFEALQPLPSSQ